MSTTSHRDDCVYAPCADLGAGNGRCASAAPAYAIAKPCAAPRSLRGSAEPARIAAIGVSRRGARRSGRRSTKGGVHMFKPRRGVSARLVLVALLAAALAMALTGVAQAKDKRELGVMTQNLYLGSSLDAAVQAQTQLDFLLAATTIWGTVQFTNFPARSDAIANEIASEQPDLIGLQEVSKWTTSGATALPSLDFLAILQQDLADR